MFLNRLLFFPLLAPFLAPFWSHFGSQVRHYTPFGRPGGQNRLTKHRQKKRGQQNEISGAGRGGGRDPTVGEAGAPAFIDIWAQFWSNFGSKLGYYAPFGWPGSQK